MAVVLAVGWIVSTIALMINSIGGSTHQYASYALAIAMVAGLPVLTFLKNLSTHLQNDTSPDRREQGLVAVSLTMLVGAWAIYLLS
jgi:hypothetical protein